MPREQLRNALYSLAVILMVFGPIAAYHYEVNRLTQSLAAVGVEVTSISFLHPSDAPGTEICRLTLRLTNPGSALVRYLTAAATVTLGEHTTGLPAGDHGLLGPGESVDLTKDLTLPASALGLDCGDKLEMSLAGQVYLALAVRWGWFGVKAHKVSSFNYRMVVDSAK